MNLFCGKTPYWIAFLEAWPPDRDPRWRLILLQALSLRCGSMFDRFGDWQMEKQAVPMNTWLFFSRLFLVFSSVKFCEDTRGCVQILSLQLSCGSCSYDPVLLASGRVE